jgi:hypothetical protein
MCARIAIVIAVLSMAGAVVAEPMNADTARRFIVGKMFSYSCFDGTRGTGRIFGDGSVAGTIQLRGSGPMHHASLPAGTVRVKGESICASLRGMPFEPCFNLDRTDGQSFRGSVAGLGFAYCDFTRRPAPSVVRATWHLRGSLPLSLEPPAVTAKSGE